MTRWGIAIDQLLLVQAQGIAADARREYQRVHGAACRQRQRNGEPRGGARQRERALAKAAAMGFQS